MSRAYYNEIDPFAAQWLRNLILAGHIAPGDVDERDIRDVRPNDLTGYTQYHFFAGIGVWSYALRQAGWPDNRPVWTGSCPCQPFSVCGVGGGFDDKRHLWPFFHHLISQCRPSVVFGEQVASKDGLEWLDLVHADMEGTGYAFAAVDLCAAGVGAPHIRQRLWFVADTNSTRLEKREEQLAWEKLPTIERSSDACGVGNTASNQQRGSRQSSESDGQQIKIRRPGAWSNYEFVQCADGRWRPVEPGTFPLANGVTQRVGRLRAYGNAIVAQVACEVIGAYLDGELPL